MLDSCIEAATQFHKQLKQSERFLPLMPPELDIVVYTVDAATSSDASRRARRLFEHAADNDLHLALIELPTELVRRFAPQLNEDSDTTTCLRSVLMKPEHMGWLDRIMKLLEASATEIT